MANENDPAASAPMVESLMLSLAGRAANEADRSEQLKVAIERTTGKVERTLVTTGRPPVHVVTGERKRLEALRQEFPDLVIERNSPLELF
jgi:hypothetical protein